MPRPLEIAACIAFAPVALLIFVAAAMGCLFFYVALGDVDVRQDDP